MKSTLTSTQVQAITSRLAAQSNIPAWLGNEHEACSVGAINLALTGQLTGEVPECMSHIIGWWIIRTQDRMPADMRNSTEWRALLPLAAGTGRDPALEKRRSALIVQHMWEVVLPLVQPRADAQGYGVAWREMCEQRTEDSARKAHKAVIRRPLPWAVVESSVITSDYAATAANANLRANETDNAYAADDTAYAAYAACSATVNVAEYVADWQKLDPINLLQQLVNLA